jgi:iron complex transport system substrate-binding protein
MHQAKRFSRRKFLSLSLTSAGAASVGVLLKPNRALAQESRAASVVFCDGLGRKVRIPTSVGSVTPTSVHAQVMLAELCPNKIASLAIEISEEDAADYEGADMDGLVALPETGTLASTSDTDVDPDEVAEVSPTVMLDVGLPKEGLADRLNALQLETGIPHIFIDISFGRLPEAYRALGSLLGCRQRAEDLAAYVETAMAEVRRISDSQEASCRVFYAQREQGLRVCDGIDLQLEAISYAGGTPVTEPYDYAAKTVHLDTLAQSAVDLILFDDNFMTEVLSSGEGEVWELWSGIVFAADTVYAISPALYHSWLGSLVYAQSIGLLWLCSILWPTSCNYDINERAQGFYNLFYGYNVAEEKTRGLVGVMPDGTTYDILASNTAVRGEEMVSYAQ